MHCFISGFARSGTTALVKMLNGHHDINIGIERNRRLFSLYMEVAKYKDDVFEWLDPPVFEMASDAKVIGDKLPMLFRFYDDVQRSYPDAVWLITDRDIVSIANSWQARHDNPLDKTWVNGGYDAAIATIKKHFDIYNDMARHDNVHFIPYENINDRETIEGVLGLFDLQWDDGIEKQFAHSTKTYEELLKGRQ